MFTLQDEMLFWVKFPQSPHCMEKRGFRRWWPNEVPQLAREKLRQSNSPLTSSGHVDFELDGVGEGQLSRKEIS